MVKNIFQAPDQVKRFVVGGGLFFIEEGCKAKLLDIGVDGWEIVFTDGILHVVNNSQHSTGIKLGRMCG